MKELFFHKSTCERDPVEELEASNRTQPPDDDLSKSPTFKYILSTQSTDFGPFFDFNDLITAASGTASCVL